MDFFGVTDFAFPFDDRFADGSDDDAAAFFFAGGFLPVGDALGATTAAAGAFFLGVATRLGLVVACTGGGDGTEATGSAGGGGGRWRRRRGFAAGEAPESSPPESEEELELLLPLLPLPLKRLLLSDPELDTRPSRAIKSANVISVTMVNCSY